MEDTVRERCKAFASTHRSEKEQLAYTFAFWHALPITVKASAKAFLLLALLLYLHLTFPQQIGIGPPTCGLVSLFLIQTLCIAKPKAIWLMSSGLPALRRLIPFLLFSSKFLAAATNFSATGSNSVVYIMLKHLSHSGMDLFPYLCDHFWSLHFFPFIWKSSSLFPFTIGKTTQPTCFYMLLHTKKKKKKKMRRTNQESFRVKMIIKNWWWNYILRLLRKT